MRQSAVARTQAMDLPPPSRRDEPDKDLGGAERVGRIIERWLRRSGVGRTGERDRLWDVWTRLLGRDAKHTRFVGLKNHVLTVQVDSSPLLAELRQFRKQELLEGLRAEVKSYFVRDIRFRLQTDAPRRPGAAGRI